MLILNAGVRTQRLIINLDGVFLFRSVRGRLDGRGSSRNLDGSRMLRKMDI